jgi:hypothetical protein
MQRRYSCDKDLDALVRKMIRKGWTYRRRSRHGCLSSPHGGRVMVSCTPSDRRTLVNLRAQIRRVDA